MELLKIASNHTLFLSILIGILIINFGCIIYLVIREKKEDKKEIDEILSELEEETIKEEIKIEDKEKEEKQDLKLEENKREVEEMLMKMQKDLEATPEDVVTNFENEQEENSIISYQELLKSVKEKKEIESKVTQVKIEEDIKEEKIEIEEFDNEDTIRLEPIVDTNKKFKNTDFISPIFGKQDNEIKYPTVPKLIRQEDEEETISLFDSLDMDYEEKIVDTRRLEAEIKKNDDFLKALKEFRKNLD
ncbi:MAG: hypothetical protein E7157_02280 [Lactobacillales bacterium]|nr:hypothetical protein [Lactobacillales bacterium]